MRHFVHVACVLCLFAQVTLAELAIKGLHDEADIQGRDITLTCLLQLDGTTIKNISDLQKPFTVLWNFTEYSSSAANVVASLTSFGNSTIKKTASDPLKYDIADGINLNLKKLEFRDAGTYSCSLLPSQKSLSAQVYVLGNPQCKNLKTVLNVNEETSFNCHINYNGNKAPLMSWQHNSQKINNTHKEEVNGSRWYRTQIVTMHFAAQIKFDGYVYRCHIVYPNTSFSYICQSNPPLTVLYPVQTPSILLDPYYNAGHQMFNAGSNIRLQCYAKGHPHPNYRWEFLPLDQNSSHKIELSQIQHYQIINAHRNSMGNYTCVASNKVENVMYYTNHTVSIRILEKQLPPQGPQYRVSSSSSVHATRRREETPVGDVYMSPYAIGALVSAALAIVLIVIFITLVIKFRARERRLRERFSRAYDEMMDDQEQELLDDNIQPTGVDESQVKYGRMKQYWEIPRKDIRLMDILATGSYSEIWRAKMRKNPDTTDIVKVAVKKLLDDASELGRKFFLAEMEVMKMLKSDPNVICLIGCYTLNEPWMLMLEYAQEGTLQKYLQKYHHGEQEVEISSSSSRQSVRMKNNNKMDSHKLLTLAAQVANGLLHLHRFKLIYYRLSASSVLVSKGGMCKLSGFGFQQDVTERNLYEKESFPIRWMAPESLRDKEFTVKSDVWAYGILVWEILHFGMMPYPDMESNETVQEEVLSGYRLPQPTHCSKDLYSHLTQCWKEVPDSRPNYEGILQVLRQLDLNHSAHIILDDLQAAPSTNPATETI